MEKCGCRPSCKCEKDNHEIIFDHDGRYPYKYCNRSGCAWMELILW